VTNRLSPGKRDGEGEREKEVSWGNTGSKRFLNLQDRTETGEKREKEMFFYQDHQGEEKPSRTKRKGPEERQKKDH